MAYATPKSSVVNAKLADGNCVTKSDSEKANRVLDYQGNLEDYQAAAEMDGEGYRFVRGSPTPSEMRDLELVPSVVVPAVCEEQPKKKEETRVSLQANLVPAWVQVLKKGD